ncbi:DEAD/DEAH box helicase [Pelobacter seleniigenes]|uniref:DEAD/DEAH box helicase n=1 Tax=Pelobacter seleniigenes TaxID=407188 RepID=UPI0004A6BCF7|nr:DEAD/DEAH box helicase [Pelobacter seleniigenes]
MAVSDFIKNLISKNEQEKRFELVIDRDGLNFVLPKSEFALCEKGEGSGWLLHQYVCLQMLEEQGFAYRIVNGFTVPSENAVLLEPDIHALLELPPSYQGRFEIKVDGQTGQSAFSVKLIPVLPGGDRVPLYQLKGPCLQLSEKEIFLLSSSELTGLQAVENHHNLSSEDKSEHRNINLVGCLQHSQKEGMQVDLAHFNKLRVVQPDSVGLTATEQSDGSLLLTPSYGTGAAPDDINNRLGQLNGVNDLGTLRIKDQIVVLDEKRLQATQEILTNQRIPKSQVQEFLKAPSAFIDASLVDLDTGFSIRVKGATRFQFMQFGETDASGIDWFQLGCALAENSNVIKEVVVSKEDLAALREKIASAQKQGAEIVTFEGRVIDISDPLTVEKTLTEIESTLNDAQLPHLEENEPIVEKPEAKEERSTVSLDEVTDSSDNLLKIAEVSDFSGQIDFAAYLRQPYPHQDEGIRWMLGLANMGFGKDIQEVGSIQGALLADDMGLGKTYMALVGIGEYYNRIKDKGLTEKPVLIVAPLSLIENWEDEVAKTFAKSPFRDIVVLQSGRDLNKFKISGAQPETRQSLGEQELLDADAIRYALKIGKTYGADRLDMPRRLVLVTYQTLRDYQFSMCRVDWSVVIFDEAQNIKNPNTLQTRAAKGLKAHFKLLATGTPVENSLADFWCLMDTAQPGLLGTWAQFRDQYVRPINQASVEEQAKVRLEVGQQLRLNVGKFMLRRLKEDNLKGLPAKRIYTGVPVDSQDNWSYLPEIASQMQSQQLAKYDEIIESYNSERQASQGRGQALGALMRLRETSLHPSLSDEQGLFSKTSKEAMSILCRSAKLENLVAMLEMIRRRQEKVIIFVMTKKLQRFLKIWFEQIFAVKVNIINGDTKAVASKKDSLTRKGIIENFESQAGFAIIIMSPVAAGVGLTVVGANNVIHLERHWNPAKEAQATDRVYRIGQKKDVNIYLPALHHPTLTSFDVNLDRLLQKKMTLKDAVVTPQAVTAEEMEGLFVQPVN